jgi:hypothetical protein
MSEIDLELVSNESDAHEGPPKCVLNHKNSYEMSSSPGFALEMPGQKPKSAQARRQAWLKLTEPWRLA